MQLTVVLSSYNAVSTIGLQLERLAAQRWTQPWEIVVSDNGSTDGTRALVAEWERRLPNLRFVDSSDRRGLSHALNVGVRAARGDAIAFCDNDDEVGDGWVAAMGEALAHHEAVAGRLDHDRLNEPWTIVVRGRPQADGLVPYKGYFPFAFSANLGVRRSCHDAIGGFDEELLTAQDMDYCWRLQSAGVTLTFVPDAVVYYRHRRSMRDAYSQARQYASGTVALQRKHHRLGLPQERGRVWKELRPTLSLVRQAALIRGRGDLGRWLWSLGWRVGHVEALVRRPRTQ